MVAENVRADDGLGFNNVPEIYDRGRPEYPSELFGALFSYVRRDQDVRAVEIGPGTGKATRPLLERGIAVTAVEPGAKLAATSFHWLDKAPRFQACHDLLREGGALAVVHTNQIESTADEGFFARVQPVYDRHQDNDPRYAPPAEDDLVPEGHAGLVASGLFDDATLHKYRWDQRYTSREYADLMRSYSGTQAMEPLQQEAMIGDVCAFIDAEFGGAITRPLVMTLSLGRRV